MPLSKKSSKPINGTKKAWLPTIRRPKLTDIFPAVLLVALASALILNLFTLTVMEQVTPGDVAQEDVFARTELTVPDVETTQARRREAMEQAPNVYTYDPRAREKALLTANQVLQLAGDYLNMRKTLESAARKNGQRGQLQQQLDQLTGQYERQVTALVPASVFYALTAIDDLESLTPVVRDVLERIYAREYVTDRNELKLVNGEAILVDPEKNQQYLTRGFPPVLDRAGLKSFVNDVLKGQGRLTVEERRVILSLVQHVLVPNYVLDATLTAQNRQAAAESVEPSFLRKKTGEVIVRRGERITSLQARFINTQNEQARSSISQHRSASVVALLAVLVFFLYRLAVMFQRRHVRDSATPVFPVLAWAAILGLVILKGAVFVLGAVGRSLALTPLIAEDLLYYAVPFAFPVALVTLLIGGVPAAILLCVMTVLVALLTAGNVPLTLFLILSSLGAVYVLRRQAGRTTVLFSGAWLALINLIILLLFTGYFGGMELTMQRFVLMVAVSLVGGFLVTALVSLVLPLFESAFGITTDIRLLELANMNSPLLVELSMKAPGTYQHSILVANLVEAAAKAINANALLARVGTYYHDIGKMVKPEYFVENQRPGDENRHERLTPKMSAIILTNHVKDGVRLAAEHNLPEQVVRFITEHHGTKLMAFFYNKALTQAEETGDVVEEPEYRYAGPKPSMKETAILMMADAVEAASRTLKAPITAGKLQNLVTRIIKSLIDDDQFSECDLTFQELQTISDSFLHSLAGMFHTRVDYPGYDFNRDASGSENEQSTGNGPASVEAETESDPKQNRTEDQKESPHNG